MCKKKLEKEREEESREEFRERGCCFMREKRVYGSCDEDGRREEDRFGERKGKRTRERCKASGYEKREWEGERERML